MVLSCHGWIETAEIPLAQALALEFSFVVAVLGSYFSVLFRRVSRITDAVAPSLHS